MFVRKVASFVGQIISMSTVVGSVSQLMTRSLSIDIISLTSWNDFIVLSDESCRQIQFWLNNIEAINVRKLTFQPSCVKLVYSDASGHAFGGYVVDSKHGISHGMWSLAEMTKSSTWRELVTVQRVLISLNHEVGGNRVKWFTDNKNVVSIICKGSMKEDLQKVALNIYRHCLVNGIHLEMDWIPRSLNEKADFISNLRDTDDWGVSVSIFNSISELWGPYKVDWFASDSNHKLYKFYSRYWNMKCSGIDAFTESWQNVCGWLSPPIYLVCRVLAKMSEDEIKGALVVPMWKSASFWPMLCSDGSNSNCFVKGVVYLPTLKDFYVCGKSYESMFGNVDLDFPMLCLKIDFS